MQQKFTIIAKTMAGLEKLLADELKALGAEDIALLNRAVQFKGDKVLLYLCNLKSALALRFLVPVFEFEFVNQQDFYAQLIKVKWEKWLDLKMTFSIDHSVNSSQFKNSQFAALRMKDAIADAFMQQYKKRPNVDIKKPDLRFNLFINENKASVSLDSSGHSLHKRGFRLQKNIAPINEVLAAGIIRLTGWDGAKKFLDPMCGSGTFLQEAALYYTKTPPNIKRLYFGFFSWKDFDQKLWERVKIMAQEESRALPENLIFGSDINEKQIDNARENIKAMGFEKQIILKQVSLGDQKKPADEGVIIINPPYGERIQTTAITDMYQKIGDHLKQKFQGWEAWVISSNIQALKLIGLKATAKIPLYNGPLLCSLRQYKLYRGSKKASGNK